MAQAPNTDRNTLVPRENSDAPSIGAPSVVIYDADALRAQHVRNYGNKTDRDVPTDNEDPMNAARNQTVMTTQGAMLTQNDISALNQSDNVLVNADLSHRTQSFEASLPPRRNSDQSRQAVQAVQTQALSPLMLSLKQAMDQDSQSQLMNLAQTRQINQSEEALMLMYAAVAVLSTPQVFKLMMQKHQNFKLKPVWHVLFSSHRIFQVLQNSPTMAERQKFDEIVMKVALDKDLLFIVEAVLERSVITPQLLSLLLRQDLEEDKQQNMHMIVGLMTRRPRPQFISDHFMRVRKNKDGKQDYSLTKKLQFVDIIESMIEMEKKSNEQIENMMKLMHREVDRNQMQFKPNDDDDDGDDDQNKLLNYDELFKLFIVKRKIRLLRFLFSLDKKVFDFHADLFLKTLELEAYDMAALLFKEFFRLLRDMDNQQMEFAVSQVVSSYNRSNGMLDFKAYLVRQFTEQMQLRHARALLDAIRTKVKTVSKQNILVMNLNVVKSACLLIENLADIGLKFNQLQVRCSKLRQDIIVLTKEYMKRVESEYEMKYLLLEKDFEHRDSLDIITKYNIVEFLETQLAENVVKEIWRSAYATSDSIFSASTNHMLTFKFQDCVRDMEFDQPFFRMKDVRKIEAHIFQFTVWRFSPKARMLQEFLVTLLFTFIVDGVINGFQDQIPRLREFENQLFKMEDQMTTITDTSSAEYMQLEAKTRALQHYFEPMRLKFYEDMMFMTYVFFAVLFFAIQHVPEIIYTTITKRQFNAYSFKNILDFVMFMLFFTFICISYGNNLGGAWKEQLVIGDQTRADVYVRNFFLGAPRAEELLLLFCIGIIWFRLFYLMIFNTMFGTTWGITARLLPTLASYILFYFVEVIFFALIAELAFRRLELYNTFDGSFYTLFYSGFGFFDYDDFKLETQFGYFFGLVFLLGFLVCNLGLITSIFTAVIVVLYDEYYKHKGIFSMIETLRVRPVMQADKEYSALISLPPPLNGLLFFLAPFLMTSKNPEYINKAILWVAYLPLLIMTFLVFTFYNFLLLPVTYVKMFFHKMIMIFVYSKSYRVSRADKFMLWIFFAIVGPFRLLANVLVDLFAFLHHCVLQDLPKTKVQIRERPLTNETIKLAAAYFKHRRERLIVFKQAAGELRDQLSIFQKIGQIFVPAPLVHMNVNQRPENDVSDVKLISEREFEIVFNQIREYSTIKQILEGNSEKVLYQKQRVKSVDCQLMNVLLEDVMRTKTIAKVADDNFIFIRRAIDVKTRASMDRKHEEKQKLDSDVARYAERPKTNDDFEDCYKREKVLRHAVRKLVNLKTWRMLDVLGYSTTEKDVRRLDYAIKSFGSENELLQRKLTQLSFGPKDPNMGGGPGGPSGDSASLSTFFGPESGKALEERISQLGMGIPKLDHDLQSAQQEIQQLVEHYIETTKEAQGAQDREIHAANIIKNLHGEMESLRENAKSYAQEEPTTLDKFIKNDYFYNEVNTIPRVVTFKDGNAAQPDGGEIDQRPTRTSFMAGGGKSHRSFVTNQIQVRDSFGVGAAIPTTLQRQQAEQKKQKMIPLSMVKKVSKVHQLKQSLILAGEPEGLFSKPGEDSDVPYISDNSGM